MKQGNAKLAAQEQEYRNNSRFVLSFKDKVKREEKKRRRRHYRHGRSSIGEGIVKSVSPTFSLSSFMSRAAMRH